MDFTLDEVFGECLPNVVASSLDLRPYDQHIIDNEAKPRVQKMDPCHSSRLTTKHQKLDEMENHRICEKSLELIENFGIILGVNLRFDWKPGVLFASSLFQMFTVISQLTYTQYLHVKTHNYYRLLETLACYGITISMVIKIWLLLFGFQKRLVALRALFNSTVRICEINSDSILSCKIRDRLLSNYRFYKWTGFVVILSILIFVAYPVKALLVDHELISLLPIEIMLLDQSTISGFVTANIIMAVMGVFACFATAYAILIIVATILNYSIFVDRFENDIKSLDAMWDGISDTSVSYRHLFIRNICRKQQDMDAYIPDVKQVLDDYIFLYFCTSYLGQIICLFQIVVSDWKSGYGIAYGMFLEMMFYCLMGTKLSSDNERVCYALQQSKWWSYDIHSQKLFLTLWIASSNVKELSIGTLAPLTVSTGTDIIKSIYTYYNLMLEVV